MFGGDSLSPMKHFFLYLFLVLGSFACTVHRKAASVQGPPMDTLWTSSVLGPHHTGFALYDLGTGKPVYEYQADKYFTPASNTKLFTFFAGLKTLGDSVEALRYIVRNDSLIFWGTGDPTLLNLNYGGSRAIDFLKSRSETLVYWPGRFEQDAWGSGWAWDDYNDYYQAELSALPLYGNVVRFSGKQAGSLSYMPRFFELIPDLPGNRFSVRRDFMTNDFHATAVPVAGGYEQDVPYRTSPALTVKLLQEATGKSVGTVQTFSSPAYQSLRSVPSDSLYKHMLQPSDNFMAEQILLLVASRLEQPLKSSTAIDYVLKNHLADLPDKASWVDGSGLSRFNLFTPRDIIVLLTKILQTAPRERVFPLLAVGGKTGTIRNYFKAPDGEPYVFAKSGSLNGVYNLSGYLTTKSGKTFAFSFMNNNFVRPTSEIRRETERILTAVHNQY